MRVAPERHDHSENVGVALSQNHPAMAATAASTVTLYSADGLIAAVQEEHDGVIADVPQIVGDSVADDDLTSLTWLQNKNLLKSVHEIPRHEYVDDSGNESNFSNSSASSSMSSLNITPPSDPNASVTDYYVPVEVDAKPPFSFSCLIFMAIEESTERALPVKDIYVWILKHFPYYRNAPTGWKNSVRHNLSLNKCFKKVDKSPNLGKGSLWTVEQRFRPCLVQALQKTPYKQYLKFMRKLNIRNCNLDEEPIESVQEVVTSVDENDDVVANDLQSSQTIFKEDFFDIDAAATAMLVLKHGAYAFDMNTRSSRSSSNVEMDSPNDIKDAKPAFTNCPSEDHNYGYHYQTSVMSSAISARPKANQNNDTWDAELEELEERRKIVEGADALLNLAGITTCSSSGYNTRKRMAAVDETIAQTASPPKQPSPSRHPKPVYRPRLVRKERARDDDDGRRRAVGGKRR